MAPHQIKHRITGAVLFEGEYGTLRECAEAAVRARASLAGANLTVANLAGASLARANLAGANLTVANLAGASLARANLAGANLTVANLAGASLARAYLAGAQAVIPAGYPDGYHAYGWRRDGTVMVQVGCRSMSLAEGRTYWAGKDTRREVMAALDYIEVVARLRGWIKGE